GAIDAQDRRNPHPPAGGEDPRGIAAQQRGVAAPLGAGDRALRREQALLLHVAVRLLQARHEEPRGDPGAGLSGVPRHGHPDQAGQALHEIRAMNEYAVFYEYGMWVVKRKDDFGQVHSFGSWPSLEEAIQQVGVLTGDAVAIKLLTMEGP